MLRWIGILILVIIFANLSVLVTNITLINEISGGKIKIISYIPHKNYGIISGTSTCGKEVEMIDPKCQLQKICEKCLQSNEFAWARFHLVVKWRILIFLEIHAVDIELIDSLDK